MNANDHIQSLRQQLLLQELQSSSSNPEQTSLPSDFLTKLLVQLQTQQTQIDQMKTIIQQMRTIIENQQQIIQGYQEQHSNHVNEQNTSKAFAPAFKQITLEDIYGSIAQTPSSNNANIFVNETLVGMSSFQQLNHQLKKNVRQRRASGSKGNEDTNGMIDVNESSPQEKQARKEDDKVDKEDEGDNNTFTTIISERNNGKTLASKRLPKRKNMKKTEFNVSKWTYK